MARLNSFQKLALSTVLATLFLIFVGSLVRATGAGLGCPDWPKCFGMWIPPTSAAELPPAFEESQFNLLKTWTEYINRLIGVVIGLLIFATLVTSFRYLKSDKSVFGGALAAFVLVLFQGWLGGRVVASELDEWLITIHMLTAIVIVMILLFATAKASTHLIRVDLEMDLYKKLLWVNAFLLVCTFIQIGLGTQVRELVDVLTKNADIARGDWLSQHGLIDEIHRSFSWLLIVAGAANIWISKRDNVPVPIKKLVNAMAIIIVVQIGYGIILTNFGIPPLFQILHLTFAAVLICVEFLALLLLYFSNVHQKQPSPSSSSASLVSSN